MLEARKIKSRGRARAARPGGRRSSTRPTRRSTGCCGPGVRESEVVAAAMQVLFELGLRARRGDQRDLRRPLQPASAHVLGPAAAARATRRSSTSSTRSWATGRATTARSTSSYATPSQLDAYKQCREWLDDAIDRVRPGATTDQIAEVWPTAQEIGMQRRARGVRPAVRPRARRRPVRVADDLAAALVRRPGRARGRDGVRARDVLRRLGRPLGGAHRGGGRSSPRPARR